MKWADWLSLVGWFTPHFEHYWWFAVGFVFGIVACVRFCKGVFGW
ncbi:hypothetical protein AAC03nite_38760 [Alicyclobacillus acidoterrestris]|nr:hypothetical protein AAC03nite_38760 [Alicyclobacillus acidoterrestris]